MQNSHLLQVIADLSSEVEHMREVFRIRGWSLGKLAEPEAAKLQEIVEQQKQLPSPSPSPAVEPVAAVEEKRQKPHHHKAPEPSAEEKSDDNEPTPEEEQLATREE